MARLGSNPRGYQSSWGAWRKARLNPAKRRPGSEDGWLETGTNLHLLTRHASPLWRDAGFTPAHGTARSNPLTQPYAKDTATVQTF